MVAPEGAPRGKCVAHRRVGLVRPGGHSGRGPLRTWVRIIWHGRPICSVFGSAILHHPKWPVSLKTCPQIQIQIPAPSPPPPPPAAPVASHRLPLSVPLPAW